MPRGVYERKPRDANAASATPQQPKAPRKYTRRARPPEAKRFIPAYTADDRLVLVNGGGEPQIFDPEQTAAIATLLLNHFE